MTKRPHRWGVPLRRSPALVAAGLVGLGAACASSPPPLVEPGPPPAASAETPEGVTPSRPVASSSTSAPTPPAKDVAAAARAGLVAALEKDALGEPTLPRVLYTWTTEEQIAQLRRDRKLLVRSTSPTKGPDFFQRVLTERARRGDFLAKTLLDPRFRKARFAWPAAWPTVRGFPGESYGDRLVRVVLHPDALVLELARSRGTWRVRNLAGQVMSNTVPLDRPGDIAAVLFVNDLPKGARGEGDGLDTPATYREFVLVNEARISSWEIATGTVHAEVLRGRELMEAAAAVAATEGPSPLPGDWQKTLPDAFRGDIEAGWRGAFAAALALGSANYLPSTAELTAIAAALAAVPGDDRALTHEVTATFPPGPLVGVVRPLPPRILGHGTF